MIIADKLYKLRMASGLSQEELASAKIWREISVWQALWKKKKNHFFLPIRRELCLG